jgi:signal transduction histidine kinase
VSGVLWSGRDITELKQMQTSLVQSQKMESIGQLAAGVAHEINTPIGIILGYAQLLKEDVEEDSSFYEDLQIIEKQSKICRKIVSDLLGFSRHTESSVSSVDINESIDQVLSMVEHTYNLDRVTIEKDFTSFVPPITGDREKLKQVFINLLGNAYDAIGSDGTITIGTGFDKENDVVTISVADTGQGIAPEILEKVFDPFFTTKAVGKGTGLGLSVSFGIIQEHGGKIEVKSPSPDQQPKENTDGKGTVFIVYLPVKGVASLDSEKGEIKDGENIGTG